MKINIFPRNPQRKKSCQWISWFQFTSLHVSFPFPLSTFHVLHCILTWANPPECRRGRWRWCRPGGSRGWCSRAGRGPQCCSRRCPARPRSPPQAARTPLGTRRSTPKEEKWICDRREHSEVELRRFLKMRNRELRFLMPVHEMRNYDLVNNFFSDSFSIPIWAPIPDELLKTDKEPESGFFRNLWSAYFSPEARGSQEMAFTQFLGEKFALLRKSQNILWSLCRDFSKLC